MVNRTPEIPPALLSHAAVAFALSKILQIAKMKNFNWINVLGNVSNRIVPQNLYQAIAVLY